MQTLDATELYRYEQWSGPHVGPRGGTYWVGAESGRVEYGDEPPEDRSGITADEYRTSVMAKVDKQIGRSNHINGKTLKRYRDAIESVIQYMDNGSLKRLDDNAHFSFHQSVQAVTVMAVGLDGAAKMHQEGKAVAGFWRRNRANEAKGRLYLDGESTTQTMGDIYSHEFGHAIDGNAERGTLISQSSAWRRAWKKEINTDDVVSPLSDYAKTDEKEGFAEFARLVFTGHRRDARELFPECWKVWTLNGLG